MTPELFGRFLTCSACANCATAWPKPGFRTQTVTLVTTLLEVDLYPADALAELYQMRWPIGVSREGHRIQSVEVRPRRKDSGLVAWEAPWRANKTVEPSDNMRRQAHAQHTRLQRAVNADVASFHATPVAETVDNVRRQQGLAERSPRRQPSPAGSQR